MTIFPDTVLYKRNGDKQANLNNKMTILKVLT